MIVGPAMDMDEVCRTSWDAIVIGAGPVGALAARQIALAGPHTLLVITASRLLAPACQ